MEKLHIFFQTNENHFIITIHMKETESEALHTLLDIFLEYF